MYEYDPYSPASFGLIRARRQDFELFREIQSRINQAIWPFRSGKVYIELKEFPSREFWVWIHCLPNDICVIQADQILRQMDEYYLATEVGLQAGKYFASLPRIEPGNNIILGDN